ncbi:hypothetical protein LCM08_19015 [Salipiger pacificus]|nr:hypothetical protein [Alloyangia pacifica]MCA0947016.1 hypothetical protein [Alloyangia pacifica]
MSGEQNKSYIGGFGLREALFLALCTVLLVSTKIFFRLKLGIPGHSAFFLAFCLVLGRTLVPRGLAATFVGVLAGLAMMALGLGKAGPLIVLQTGIGGLMVDALALLGLTRQLWGAALLGVAAGLGRGPAQLAQNLLIGMDWDLALTTAGLKLLPAALFGALGGALALVVARRLERGGLAPGAS